MINNHLLYYLSRFHLSILFSLPSFTTVAHDVVLPNNFDDFSLYEISSDVYVAHGIQSLPDETNAAFMSNSGVIVTSTSVVIIDTGGSWEVGRRLVVEIRKLTDKPVVAVINTHIHGDHWLGNSAIQSAFPNANFYAHTRAIKRLKAGEAEEWSETISKMINKHPTSEQIVTPNIALDGGESIDFGGFTFNIHHTGHAHTDHDVMVELTNARVLFAGDVIEHGRLVSSDVPRDFDAAGQIEAIEYALNLPVNTFVPGHGATGKREIALDALNFLKILYKSVKMHYDTGLLDYEMRDLVAADLNEFREWFNFNELGRLISFVYLQIEAEDFN